MVLPESLSQLLLPWYQANRRDLPWRHSTDPYRIWLSEIMLQQTRVEAVKGYYLRFLEALPDIRSLAECSEDKLLKLWEGLGYYSRARNLQKAARLIVTEYGGMFPREPERVLALPGIGDYTAGAVCSICFDLPTPAVDGNVLRVCTRLTGDRRDITLPGTKQAVKEALLERYPPEGRGEFNQALMELGAVVCIPKGEPDCAACPLGEVCRSRREQLWRELPVRTPKKPRVKEDITVFLLRCQDRLALGKRPSSGLLAGLWEFPSLPGILTPQQALDQAAEWGCHPLSLGEVKNREHIFTHREWKMTGYEIFCSAMPDRFRWAGEEELAGVYSLPSAFRKFLYDD